MNPTGPVPTAKKSDDTPRLARLLAIANAANVMWITPQNGSKSDSQPVCANCNSTYAPNRAKDEQDPLRHLCRRCAEEVVVLRRRSPATMPTLQVT